MPSGLSIFTVLRSGGDFLPVHVERLQRQLRTFAPGCDFYCLSDVPSVPGYSALRHDWPGWWSKLELFRFGGPVLYFDLDTTIVGDLAPLIDACRGEPFVALRDFNPASRRLGSGMMYWSGDVSAIYDRFCADDLGHMARCVTPAVWGDQGFIDECVAEPAFFQTLMPDAVVSYKKHCMGGVPAGARVVCHHGNPRPWEI